MLAVAAARDRGDRRTMRPRRKQERRPRRQAVAVLESALLLSHLYGTESALEYEMLTFEMCRDVEVSWERERNAGRGPGPRSRCVCGMTRAFADYFLIPPVGRGSSPATTLSEPWLRMVLPPSSRFARGFRRQTSCPSERSHILRWSARFPCELRMLLLSSARTGQRRYRQTKTAREQESLLVALAFSTRSQGCDAWFKAAATSFELAGKSRLTRELPARYDKSAEYSLHCRVRTQVAVGRSTASRAKDVSHQARKRSGVLHTCARPGFYQTSSPRRVAVRARQR
jgi:hypothetical protein